MGEEKSTETEIALLAEDMSFMAKEIAAMQDAAKARASREWTVIMTIIGLIATIVVKSLGWM